MTEAEAIKLICWRTIEAEKACAGGGQFTPKRRECIASACMAWRWMPTPMRYEGTSAVFQYPSPPPTDGYCGLAGKP